MRRLRRSDPPMTPAQQLDTDVRRHVTRRWFLRECGVGLGAIALRSLLSESTFAGEPRASAPGGVSINSPGAHAPGSPLAPKPPHFAPTANRVILLFMADVTS